MWFYDRAVGKLHPKHHLMIHLIQRVVKLGNPKLYASYRDESLNGVVSQARDLLSLLFCAALASDAGQTCVVA